MLPLEEWGINLRLKINRNSIKFKTLINMIIFSIIILFVLWIFQIAFLNFFYEKYTVNNMDNIREEILEARENKLEEELEAIAYENNVCIEQVSSNLLRSYNTKIRGCQLGRNNHEIIQFELGMINGLTTTKLEIKDPVYNTKGLLYGINLDDNYIFVYTPLEDINATTSVLKNQLIYITLIVLILSVVIAYYISKKITKPIINITKNVKKFGDGDLSIEFKKNGIKEIDELADTLNYLKSELAKTNELKRDLLANVSHDLKTPLTMIKAYAEMVKDYTYKNKIKRNDNLDIIISETDRLNLLVNDILDLSKLQANKEKLNIEKFDIVEEIKVIIKRYELLVEKEAYQITFEGPEKSFVKADKSKINQVIYNLINNAINYTGKDKVVRIKASTINDRVLIEIEDTGKGIDPEEQKYIWDKYYKTNKNYQRSKIGSGIGLSIVKEILTYHNFEYGLNSAKNKGTTFFFYINM